MKRSLWTQASVALLFGVVVAAATSAAIWLLLGSPGIARDGSDLKSADLYNGLRISLAVVAGLGAVVALVVAYRRQHTSEEQHALALVADAREATKLYGERFKVAAEQLGTDKSAAIRLAGVYAMLNLADDWGKGRQMCVDVLFGYLRMPFPIASDHPELKYSGTVPAGDYDGASEGDVAVRQEFQVRLAIQRTLAAHLRNPARKHGQEKDVLDFWPGIRTDFFGATLCNFDAEDCEMAWADFRQARFLGDANFRKLTVTRDTDFAGATFEGAATFAGAVFRGSADFSAVNFARDPSFGDAQFLGGGSPPS